MSELRYTLLSDGSSDKALIPVLNWLLHVYLEQYAIQYHWADLRRVDKSRRDSLEKRIVLCVELYPCDLLFIHRDAEKDPYENRLREIETALNMSGSMVSMPTICVIPVRMTEAWLIFDEDALRQAASNPNGHMNLTLPSLKRMEKESDPKQTLHQLLLDASGLSRRRLKRFPVNERVHRVAELIEDFSPLRVLPAFSALENNIKDVANRHFKN